MSAHVIQNAHLVMVVHHVLVAQMNVKIAVKAAVHMHVVMFVHHVLEIVAMDVIILVQQVAQVTVVDAQAAVVDVQPAVKDAKVLVVGHVGEDARAVLVIVQTLAQVHAQALVQLHVVHSAPPAQVLVQQVVQVVHHVQVVQEHV